MTTLECEQCRRLWLWKSSDIVCPWCEVERLQARVAELETQLDATDDERHELVVGLAEQRDECRRLLREAIERDPKVYWLSRAWHNEAAKAAGGDDGRD